MSSRELLTPYDRHIIERFRAAAEERDFGAPAYEYPSRDRDVVQAIESTTRAIADKRAEVRARWRDDDAYYRVDNEAERSRLVAQLRAIERELGTER